MPLSKKFLFPMSTELVENITCSRRPSDQCPLLGDSHAFPHPLGKPWLCSLSYQHQFVSFTITLLSLSYKIALQVPPSSSKSMQRQAHLFVGKWLRLFVYLSFIFGVSVTVLTKARPDSILLNGNSFFRLPQSKIHLPKKSYVVAWCHSLTSYTVANHQ